MISVHSSEAFRNIKPEYRACVTLISFLNEIECEIIQEEYIWPFRGYEGFFKNLESLNQDIAGTVSSRNKVKISKIVVKV